MCSWKIVREIQAARAWYKRQEKGTRILLTLLTVAVACYLVFLLWLLPEMMETVPMDTKSRIIGVSNKFIKRVLIISIKLSKNSNIISLIFITNDERNESVACVIKFCIFQLLKSRL